MKHLNENVRGNEFGKKYFGQEFERVRYAQINNNGIVIKLILVDEQRRITSAVHACIATIIIFVLLIRGTRTRMGCG